MEKTAWFKVKERQMKVGRIIDTFLNYIELQEIERGEYYIRHINEIEIIK